MHKSVSSVQVPQKEAVQVPFQLKEAQTSQEVTLALPRPQEEVVAVLLERETRQGAREGAAEERAAPHTVQDSQRQVDGFWMVPLLRHHQSQRQIMLFSLAVCSRAVCSTTLWVGQVDKKATQQDLTNLFEEFGQIESINVSLSPGFNCTATSKSIFSYWKSAVASCRLTFSCPT